jgi:hypothetical protein
MRGGYSFSGFSSASSIPSFTSSSGLGLCCIFCSSESARMRFSRDLWLACRAGAAVESGRMFPVLPSVLSRENAIKAANAQLVLRDLASSPDAFSNCLYAAGVRALAVLLGGTCWVRVIQRDAGWFWGAYGAALVSRRMCRFLRSCGSGRC